ncbi:MAG: cold shock domain-containing protein [Rhodospirillaceae bacterium]|nr:cold shock domain-containing protein [Rhodospirillaceae bacterium]
MSDPTTMGSDGLENPAVVATVKWYSVNKGVGLVATDDGRGDAVLRKSTLLQVGASRIAPGDALKCRVTDAATGRQVAEVISIRSTDESRPLGIAGADRPRRDRAVRQAREAHSPVAGPVTTGTVKFYDPWRGFGFVAPDGGGRDIYVDYRTLQAARLPALEDRQRVQVVTRNGAKGPVAVKVTIA